MQLQVITTDSPDGRENVLRHIKELESYVMDRSTPIHAEAYGAQGLVQILEIRAANGEREILVLGCRRDQIQAVLEWQSATDEAIELEELILHMVRLPDIESEKPSSELKHLGGCRE